MTKRKEIWKARIAGVLIGCVLGLILLVYVTSFALVVISKEIRRQDIACETDQRNGLPVVCP